MRVFAYIVAPLVAFFLFHSLSAQSIEIRGGVYDGLKGVGIHKAVVRILDADSREVIASDFALLQEVVEEGDKWKSIYLDEKNGAFFSINAKKAAAYILQVEKDGYELYEKELSLGETKKNTIDVGAIYLVPKAKEQTLGEATVTATKLKFFYKGDTLIYNADAFNVTQTESLRKLVEKLPGTEIKDGVIYVNGRPIENLLISGKDFFNGNIQVALDNLPAFVVKSLKVYNDGSDMHDEEYVMDLHLKRHYIGTWLAKLEASLGTQNFFGGQAMIMRFDDRQSLMVNADVNNFGQDRQMLDIASTATTYPYPITNKAGRLDYSFEPNNTWRFRFNASAQRKDEDVDSWTNSETYLLPSNLMKRSYDRSNDNDTKLDAFAALRFRKSRRWSHELSYGFNWNRHNSLSDAKGISYFRTEGNVWDEFLMEKADTISNATDLLYTLFTPASRNTETFAHRARWTSSFTLGASVLKLKANLKHSTTDTHRHENYRLTYFGEEFAEQQRRYYNLHDYALNFDVKADYLMNYVDAECTSGTVTPYATYEHDYGMASHPLYRLERMEEWSNGHSWGTDGLGLLPAEDFRSLCIDEANSYNALTGRNRGTLGARLSHKLTTDGGEEWQFYADAKGYYERRTLDYTRSGRLYPVHREDFFFAPSLSAEWKDERDTVRRWLPTVRLSYDASAAMPELTNYLPIRDNADPLNLFLGNDALKNSYTHSVSMRYGMRSRRSDRNFYVQGIYHRTHNDVGTRSSYNTATGVRTYTPENTNRTHRADVSTGYTLPLDKNKHLYLTASFSVDYYRRANLASTTDDTFASSTILENHSLAPSLMLRATVGNFSAYAYWKTDFQSMRSNGETSNYRTTSVTVSGGYSLPWSLSLNTFFVLYKNAGTSSDDLDRLQTRWDASIQRDFLDGKLGIRFSVNDILNQADTISSGFSSTGRTETYTNVMPRYFMLTITSNFNWSKNKE